MLYALFSPTPKVRTKAVGRHFGKTLGIRHLILTITFITTLLFCGRIKRKGSEVFDKTQEKIVSTKKRIVDKKNQLVENAFPTHKTEKPDSEKSRLRFKEYFQIGLTEDIRNIYSYCDYFGIDYKVLISFNCEASTINKIVETKKMTLAESFEDGLLSGEEFLWWDKKKIERIIPYKVGKEGEYWKYLWFDDKAKTAYYEEFSL